MLRATIQNVERAAAPARATLPETVSSELIVEESPACRPSVECSYKHEIEKMPLTWIKDGRRYLTTSLHSGQLRCSTGTSHAL